MSTREYNKRIEEQKQKYQTEFRNIMAFCQDNNIARPAL